VLTAWSYMWRTTAVHRWEIAGSPSQDTAPELPGSVALEDVKRITDGTGPLLHRIYRTRILGSGLGPEQLIERITDDLDRIAP